MRKQTAVGWVASIVLVGASPGLYAEDAKGSVAFKGAAFTVADAVAYKTDSGVEVALLPAPFDRKAAAKDAKIDSFDVMRMGTPHVTLRIDDDGSFSCVDYSTGQGGGSSCTSDYTKALTLTVRTAARVAGQFVMKGGTDTVDVTFDMPVESAAARGGTALPTGGGDPGKAVLAHFAALEKNDFAALKGTAPPEQRQMMEASEKSGEAKKLFQMMREMSPRKVRVLGGTADGDSAVVDFEGVQDGKPARGYADVVRINGVWYLKGTTMK